MAPILTILLVLISLCGCKPAANSLELKEFKQIPLDQLEETRFQLNKVSESAYKDIKYSFSERKGVVGSNDWYFSEATFPALKKEEFEYLIKTYSHGLSKVIYKPNTIYHLKDFLPPLMQATLGHQFVIERKQGKRLATNCWGTGYETVRREANAVTLFIAPAVEMEQILTDPKYSTLIPTDNPHLLTNPNAEPGDLIIHYYHHGQVKSLHHVSIYIDKDLFFEKIGIFSEFPYRLFHLIPNSYLRKPTPNISYEYRRFHQNPALPSAQAIFGKKLKDAPVIMPFEFDKVGRATLPAHALEKILKP